MRSQAARPPQIRIDLSETESDYVVKADVPGVRKEDIDVRVDGKQVTISAELTQEKDEKKDGRVIRSERSYGYVSRSFTLDNDVDATKVDAKYKDGVLQLTVPKKATSSATRIQIS